MSKAKTVNDLKTVQGKWRYFTYGPVILSPWTKKVGNDYVVQPLIQEINVNGEIKKIAKGTLSLRNTKHDQQGSNAPFEFFLENNKDFKIADFIDRPVMVTLYGNYQNNKNDDQKTYFTWVLLDGCDA